MNSHTDAAIAVAMGGYPPGTNAERELRALVSRSATVGCQNVVDKLIEFKNAAASGRLDSLCAELRFGLSFAQLATTRPTFLVRDNADISFTTKDGTYLLEVVHKSAPSPISTVFYSEPALVASYASATNWRGAAFRLDAVIRSLSVTVQPWIESALLKNETKGDKRQQQEDACGALADWLASALPMAVANHVRRLDYPGSDTFFEIEPLPTGPGYMKGYGATNAWIVDKDRPFNESIIEKASKAKSRRIAAGAHGYLIGLEIEDVFASTGGDVLDSLLGPLFFRGDPGANYSYRPVTTATQRQIANAESQGRGDLLTLASFDHRESNAHGHDPGLYFRSDLADVAAVVGLYYTNAVQFIPNPFATTDIAPIRTWFPPTLAPVSEDELRAFAGNRSR